MNASSATTELMVELEHRCASGLLTEKGLFVTQRPGAGWLWDVWASVEAFKADDGAGLVAANLPGRKPAVELAESYNDEALASL